MDDPGGLIPRKPSTPSSKRPQIGRDRAESPDDPVRNKSGTSLEDLLEVRKLGTSDSLTRLSIKNLRKMLLNKKKSFKID